MKNTDAALIYRTLNGDDNAFAELVKKYQKQVKSCLRNCKRARGLSSRSSISRK